MSLVTTVPPWQSRPAVLESSSRHIIRARNYEFLPEAQTSQSKGGRFVFKISSVDQFLALKDSYFRFNIVTSLNFNGNIDGSRALAEGGVHALVKRVIVQSATGAQLCELDKYNFFHAMLSNAVDSPDTVNSVGYKYGDSMNANMANISRLEYSPFDAADSRTTYFDCKVAEVLYDASDASIDFGLVYTNAKALGKESVEPGDWLSIQFEDASPAYNGSMWAYVRDVGLTTAGASSLVYLQQHGYDATNGALYGADLGAGEITGIQLYKKAPSVGRQAARNQVARGQVKGDNFAGTELETGTSIEVVWQPSLPFFNQAQWFPLFLLTGGIIITIELEPIAELAMESRHRWLSGDTGWTDANYTISNMRYIGRLIQGSEELRETYYTLFKGDGLFFTYSNLLWYEHSSDSTSQAQQQNVGKRMVKWIATMIKDVRHVTAYNNSTYKDSHSMKNESLATGLRAQLEKYDYSALSMKYPLDSQVDLTNDLYLAEPLLYLEQIFGTTVHRFPPAYWQSGTVDQSSKYESFRFYPCALLGKTREDYMGLDLINTPIQSNFQFSGTHAPNADSAAARRYFYSFVEFDSIALFQQNHGIQVMS